MIVAIISAAGRRPGGPAPGLSALILAAAGMSTHPAAATADAPTVAVAAGVPAQAEALDIPALTVAMAGHFALRHPLAPSQIPDNKVFNYLTN